MRTRPVLVTCTAALLLVAISLLSLVEGVGSALPGSFSVFFWYLLALLYPLGEGAAAILSLLVTPALFVLWCPHLFRGRPTIPKRSLVVVPIFLLLNGMHLQHVWALGLKWRGAAYMATTVWLAVGWAVVVTVIAVLGLRRPSFTLNLAFHWAVFAWLSRYAFPYVGELP